MIGNFEGEITGMRCDRRNLVNFCRIFEAEFGLYDKKILKDSKVKRIILVSNLKYSGQTRAAIPTF